MTYISLILCFLYVKKWRWPGVSVPHWALALVAHVFWGDCFTISLISRRSSVLEKALFKWEIMIKKNMHQKKTTTKTCFRNRTIVKMYKKINLYV